MQIEIFFMHRKILRHMYESFKGFELLEHYLNELGVIFF
jgi:hypothetical protein